MVSPLTWAANCEESGEQLVSLISSFFNFWNFSHFFSSDLKLFNKADGKERPTDPYSFLVPKDWIQQPVSLNDAKLYGTDTKFRGDDGLLEVLVLPIGESPFSILKKRCCCIM